MMHYNTAREFTLRTHESDLKRIDARNGLMESFDDFFYEYVYVVMASGFRAKIAARLTPQLVAAADDPQKLRSLFHNERKIQSIEKIYARRKEWKKLRAELTDVDSLTNLPYIGEITKYHLARNIGLLSCAKPDVHLCRWCEQITGKGSEEDVIRLVDSIAKRTGEKNGTVDFSLWVWLMHNRGEEGECCHGGYAIR